jgi:predicted Zn-dependent peptidase
MKRYFALVLAVLFNCPTFSQSSELPPLENRVVEHTCANGIKLLVLERHFSPTVAIRMMFHTGSVDETSGKTGLAHMFEHMMFKGTKTLGTKNYTAEAPLLKQIDELHHALDDEKAKGAAANQTKIAQWIDQINALDQKEFTLVIENEMWNLYEREGGSELNASTSHDFTQYTVDLPSNKLQLWALLDSDRVRNPVFREFYKEREVVKEERRMRVDTDPEGKLYESFLNIAYLQHPYRNPTIGWMSDLDHLSSHDLEDFYHRFYTPDQLTIAIVGDVKSAEVIAMVERYFGTWSVPPATRPAISPELPQEGSRTMHIAFDAQPHVVVGYHIPPYPDPGNTVAFALAQLLGSGTTSRLYKNLVEKRKLASAIETSQDYPGERYAPLLIISAAPRYPHTSEEVLKGIENELERLKKEPIADWEVEKMRASVNVGLLNALQTNSGMASTLAYDQCIFGDWHYLLQFQKRINAMTAVEMQALARTLFVTTNETVAILDPLKKELRQRQGPSH